MPLTSINGVDGASQFFSEDAFEQITTRAGLEGAIYVFISIEGGDDDDLRAL